MDVCKQVITKCPENLKIVSPFEVRMNIYYIEKDWFDSLKYLGVIMYNNYSIKHNVYNPKVYTNGIKVKPYRLYKQGTQIQDISKPILHNHQNHMTGSTVNNTGKDNQRPNPSQFQ